MRKNHLITNINNFYYDVLFVTSVQITSTLIYFNIKIISFNIELHSFFITLFPELSIEIFETIWLQLFENFSVNSKAIRMYILNTIWSFYWNTVAMLIAFPFFFTGQNSSTCTFTNRLYFYFLSDNRSHVT